MVDENDLLDKEVWFVALGASNADNAGMRDFLKRHARDLTGALVINLQAVGAGELCYLAREGMPLRPGRSDHRLQAAAARAAPGKSR